MRRSRVPRAGLFPGCGFPAFPPRAVLPARGAEKANRGFGLSALGPKASGSQTHGGASIKRESCSIGRPANPSGKAARSNSGSGDHRGMKSSPGEDLGERSRASAELSCDPRSRAKRAATVEKHREIFPRFAVSRESGACAPHRWSLPRAAERVPRAAERAGACAVRVAHAEIGPGVAKATRHRRRVGGVRGITPAPLRLPTCAQASKSTFRGLRARAQGVGACPLVTDTSAHRTPPSRGARPPSPHAMNRTRESGTRRVRFRCFGACLTTRNH